MKTILLVALLTIFANSFKLSDLIKPINFQQLTILATCSDSRVKTVNQSISECQNLGLNLETQCIKNYLFNHLNGQKWDVMAQIPDKSDVKSSYWPYDDCAIRYQRYGVFKLSYTIWKATTSSQSLSQTKITPESSQSSQQIMEINPNGDCPQDKVKIANDAINYCQNDDIILQVLCIRNNIRTKLGQKWNTVISSLQKSQYFSIRYEYFDSCSVQVNSFSSRKRNYLVWKAQ